MTADYSRLDDALVRLQPFGTELSNGFTSHAPMVVEALSALGRSGDVLPWLDGAMATFVARPGETDPIDPDQWDGALGSRKRFADWSLFFVQQLDSHPWTDVVATWAPRLAPGICSDATHGAIRTGHAVRAMAQAQTPARRAELADALASWADTFQVLPEATYEGAPLAPDAALAAVPVIAPDARKAYGSIVMDLMQLDDVSEFAPVVHMLDIAADADPNVVIPDLAALFARVAVANVRDFSSAIVFIHSVTALVALWRLSPYLPADTLVTAIRYGWQASAGLYAVYATHPPAAPSDCLPVSFEALIDRAVVNGDDHAIKFAEACHVLNAAQPDPAFGAALDVVLAQIAPLQS